MFSSRGYLAAPQRLCDVLHTAYGAGFECLLQKIHSCAGKSEEIKVGLEATGHYSYNILRLFLDNGLDSVVINPLHTNFYRKSLSLRKTKTDRVDARTIAASSCLM